MRWDFDFAGQIVGRDCLGDLVKGLPEYDNAPIVLRTLPVLATISVPATKAPVWEKQNDPHDALARFADMYPGASRLIALDHNLVGTTSNALYKLPFGQALADVPVVDPERPAFVVAGPVPENVPCLVNSATPDGPVVCVGAVFDARRTPLFTTRMSVQDTARLALCAKRIANTLPPLPNRKPVVFFTTSIGPWGGVIALTELVTRLRGLGVNAHILTCREHEHRIYFGVTPHRVRNAGYLPAYLRQTFGETGVLVATHWNSVEGISPALQKLPGWQAMAYWQDREDLFVDPRGNPSVNAENARAYVKIPHRIFNAHWVAKGYAGAVIPVGIDTSVFHSQGVEDSPEYPTVVLAMHRPSTPRRGAARLEALYRNLRKRYGHDVRLEIFGEPAVHKDWYDVHHGHLSSAEVAGAMRRATVYIEPSEFQGFGLPGLEAMSCQTFLLSTDNQGIHEYGTNGFNCLIGNDLGCLFDQYMDMDESERTGYLLAGLRTAQRHSWDSIARQWAEWLDKTFKA